MGGDHDWSDGARTSEGGSPPACALCGTSIGRSRVTSTLNEKTLLFCCAGCRMVFEVLFNHPGGPPGDYRDTDLYRACVEAGIIPLSPSESSSPSAFLHEGEPRPGGGPIPTRIPDSRLRGNDEVRELKPSIEPSSNGTEGEEITFRIGGMWCATCAVLIESVLRAIPGVLSARVFFTSDLSHVRYLPHRTSPQALMERVSELGYSASASWDESEISRERKELMMRLCISSVLTMNIMMIACALYFGFFQDLGEGGAVTLTRLLWVLATPVVFYGGSPILNRALAGARRGGVSMETLIAIGSLTAYFYSTYQSFMGSMHVYFDTATMLVTLVLLGKFIESGARERVSREVTDLLRATGVKARILDGGREKWVLGGELGLGQEFLVRAGERVATDGEVLEGTADVDESFLTGESTPVRKQARDEILNGSMVLNGELRARSTRVGHETMLRQMISVIQRSLAAKVPAEQMADGVIRWIVPAVTLLAVGTATGVMAVGSTLEEAIQRGLTVLVITCPCALGIAVPLAKVASISLARACGLIVRDPAALEKIHSLDAFVFDKTGTLTEGSFTLRRILAPRVCERDVLRKVGSVESRSKHLIAREVLRKCREMGIDLPECGAFEAHAGMGVRGLVGEEEVFIGNRRFMAERDHAFPPQMDMEASEFEAQGMTTAFFAWDRSVRGVLVLGDDMGSESRKTLEALHAMGKKLWLISGDSPKTTRAIASSLPLEGFAGGMRPTEKADFVMGLQREGFRVGFVGDGINDAPALASADVAFTVGSHADLLREVSSVTLRPKNIGGLLDAIALSKLHARVSVQNLFFAFAYNALAIPVAVTGLLNPIIAVLAMFSSSLTVVGNTLRIPRSKLFPNDLSRRGM